MLNGQRPDEEVCLTLVHELVHAIEHPIGSRHNISDYRRNPHAQDSIVNAAAATVCGQFGITDYIERLASAGAPYCIKLEQLGTAEQARASDFARQLGELLKRHL